MQHKLWEALDILRDKGWCKNVQVNQVGEHCMAGAVMAAHDMPSGSYWLFLPERRLLDAAVQATHPGFTVAGFNDHPDTTWPMVEALMEKAAIRGDELVSDEPTSTYRHSLGEQL